MNARPLPSLEYLNECFELSEESASGLIWKVRPRNHFPTSTGYNIAKTRFASTHAGTIKLDKRTGKHYVSVAILNHKYWAQRIVYSIYYNKVLDSNIEIDHIDNNGLNNLPHNLREATPSENQHNAKLRSSNSSGVKGISWHKIVGMWQGRVMLQRKSHHLGYSPSLEAMESIVRDYREKLHGEFYNHGK